MPVARPDPKYPIHRQQARVARNDSFRSERSDKRVSFNNDVGVKHIPRGTKDSSQVHAKVIPRDEWANCTPVHLENPSLSSEELEKQAEDLVRLIDRVDCVSAAKPIHQHPAYTSKSLDRTNKKNKSPLIAKVNNNKVLNNDEKKNNLVNGISDDHLANNRKTNPIGKNNREDINLYPHRQSNNLKGSFSSGHQPYQKFSPTYKSVPDISSAALHYNNTSTPQNIIPDKIEHNVVDSKNFMSVDNLHDIKGKHLVTPRSYKNKKNRNEYKSADNLTDISIPGTRKLREYKPYENLQSGLSSSSDLKMQETDDSFRPKVGNMIRRFNSETDDHRVRTHPIFIEGSSPRSYKESNAYFNHNNNKPFCYTSVPLSSVEEVRQISPSREIPVIKENYSYAQVNKHDRRARSSSREYDHQSKNTDSDYSAKIIITGSNLHSRYDDDDHAYETFQVGESSFEKHYGMPSDDLYGDYKNHSNNNMNTSSIGIQTERTPKAPQRSRRNVHSMSPGRNEDYHERVFREDLQSATLVRRINHGFGRIDRSPSPPPVKKAPFRRIPKNVVPLLSDTDDSEFDYHRRMDPLAKIRNQVMIRERVQEEREAEEEEERENRLFERRHKSLLDLNSSEMQPLTIDQVDALTLEVDKRGRNTLVVAQENSPHNVSRPINEHNKSSSKSETNINKVPLTPPRSKKKPLEDYPKDTKERSKSPRIFSTLERMKKNTTDKNKSTLEKNKGKEKKKKKIKIKFFYDPRPQDNPEEDPLSRYVEYKGRSDDQELDKRRKATAPIENDPYDEHIGEKRNNNTTSNRHEYHHSLSRDIWRDKERRYRYDSSESPSRETSNPPPRHARESSRERSIEKMNPDRDHPKGRYARDSSSERTLRKNTNREPRSNVVKVGNRSDYDSTSERKEASEKRLNRDRADYYEESRDFEKRTQYNNVRNETRFTKIRNDQYDGHDGLENEGRPHVNRKLDFNHSDNAHDSSDQGPSLSDKYRSLARRDSPPRETSNLKNDNLAPPKSNVEEVTRKEKIHRQRKKFFGVLLGEGKAKSSTLTPEAKSTAPPPPSETKHISSTLPRTSQPQRESPQQSNTLQRIPPEDVAPEEITAKARDKGFDGRPYISRDREADDREKQQWESVTLTRTNLGPREKGRTPTPTHIVKDHRLHRSGGRYSAESSPSTTARPMGRANKGGASKQRYFGDTDTESGRPTVSSMAVGDNYRSLPNRKPRMHGGSRQNLMGARSRGVGVRRTSPGARGSAGSSLQSSESEADSHGGSHASRASHVSTGSNRSVYLHATAVADIPVRRSSDEAPSERDISKQSKKVTRSFSLVSPWKPRHYREKYEVAYNNKEVHNARENREVKAAKEKKAEKKSALPPRPPRKSHDTTTENPKKVGRSQTVHKDSKLSGWLRRKKNKDVKGI